jgi:hypothetical protein
MILELIERQVEVFLSFDGFDRRSVLRYGKSLEYYLKKLNVIFHLLSSAPHLTNIVFSVGKHNLAGILTDMQVLREQHGFFKFKVNIIRKEPFASSASSVAVMREKVFEWAKASGNISIDWDLPDEFGSHFENWYFSSERISVQKIGELGTWENVKW